MNNSRSPHLTDKQIIASLVNENDLTAQEREHLKDCSICSVSRHNLAAQLYGISEEARRCMPAPQRRVALPEAEVVGGKAWKSRWHAGLAVAAASFVFIITLTLPLLFTENLHPYGKLSLTAETVADERLIATTKDIEENCLPASLQEIVPDMGTVDENDDILDYMAPVEA